MAKLCELYRHFDGDGRLLYVGIAISSTVRLSGHRTSAHWFDQITRIEIERFPTRKAAMEAEMLAIGREKPLHNLITDIRKGIRTRSDATQNEIDRLILLIEGAGYAVRKNSCLSIVRTVWGDISAGRKPDRMYLRALPFKPDVNRQIAAKG